MPGKNIRESEKAEGLIYSFNLDNKLIEIKTRWREHQRLYLLLQKHTNRVVELISFPYPPMIGDAVITNLKGVEIGVRTADCVPTVAVGKEWIGVAHVGWRGLSSGILERFLERLDKREGVERLFLFVGPSAKSCCYEVGKEFMKFFPNYVIEREGKLYMDLQESVVGELKRLGVNFIGIYEKCTVCSPELPSYRRERTEKRMLTSVKIL